MGEEVTAAHARLEQNLTLENRTTDVKKEETRSLNMIKISEGKRKRALENWEIQRHGYHPLKSISAAKPMDHLQVDLIVGVPTSKEGFTAIVVSKDIHTGYIWLHPLTTRGATEVAQAIMKIIRQFGPMKIIHTDNGREFKNKLLCKITEFVKIQHRFGSSYHPRAQGAVERENSNIEKLLKKMCQGAVHTWHIHLDYVASGLNSRISSIKGTSAFALMFGREPNDYQDFTDGQSETFNQNAWEKHLEKLEMIVRPAINQKVNIAQLIREDQFNAKFKIVVFKPKDRVMAKDVTRTSKWHSFYEGPFEVIRRNMGGAYILKDSANSILPFRFPPSHLKLVTSSTPLIQKSYPVKKILSHLPIKDRPYDFDYYVQFDIPDSSPVWITSEMFDSPIPIERYWKSIHIGI
jgi:hypothetical protein